MGFTAGRPRTLSGYRPAVTQATIVRVEARGLKAVVIVRQMPAAVRYGSQADMRGAQAHVCFGP
jgi:hypothetical protein